MVRRTSSRCPEKKPSPDDEDLPEAGTEELVAYLDGELDPQAADAMASRLSLDPELRKADAYQRTWDILDVLPRPEPSSSFTTRTLSQAIPHLSIQQIVPQSAATVQTMTAFPRARFGMGFWVASLLTILVAGVGGYFAHRLYAPAPKAVAADPSLEDVPLMKNLRLYRNVDDMDYLKRLDSPDMFGDEGE